MRKWLHWAWLGACAAAVGVGCGSSGGGGQQGFAPTDDGGSSTSSGSSSGTSGSGSSSGSGSASGGTSSGDDAGGDATTSSSSSGGPIDASLDIAFPDVFYGPDTGSSSSGGPQDAGNDGPQCFPDGITCQNGVAYTCSNGVQTTQSCGNNQCVNGFGCLVCQPGTGSCNGNVGTACNSSGTGYVTNNCDPLQGESCNATNGQCTGDCASVGESYIGCEYYAMTMLNHLLDQGTFYFSLSVSNTSTKTATVTVTGGALGSTLTQTVGAGQLVEIKLPWVKSLSCGPGNSTGTCNGDPFNQPVPPGTEMQSNGAYHIRSTEPVTVYQFNPRDYQINGTYSYTNDASLLIPTNALTGNYRVAAWPTFYVWPGTIAVIGTQNGTSVTVNAPSGSLQAGAGLGTSGGTVTLNQGDVLEIESVLNSGGGQAYGTDISGTLVTANKPIQVLGGHSCVYIPATVAACDHMEEIAFPTETLRGDYLVTVPYNKNGTPQQWVKIVGVAANTHITFDPASVHAATVLNAGTVLTLQGVTQHFRVYSTDSPQQPFMVAQYMEGQDNFCTTSGTDCGDPSESVAVATGQFRNNYQFVAPTSYAENWVNVIAQNGATVTVDGTTVTGYSAIGSSGWSVAHFALPSTNNGVHKASATTGVFGIEVYGYGAYTSYMYPGGLNLTRQ